MNPESKTKTLSKRNQALIVAAKKGYYVLSGNPIGVTGSVKTELIKGRPTFNIRMDDGSISKVQVSRLVAYLKYGDEVFGDGVCVYHKDGNITNNNSDNILIGTRSDAQMSKDEGVRRAASITASNAIKKHDHNKIVEMHKSGMTYVDIMKATGIKSRGTVSFIIKKSIAAKGH